MKHKKYLLTFDGDSEAVAFLARKLPKQHGSLGKARELGRAAEALFDVVEELERGDIPLHEKIEARIILRVCKTAAIKAGQSLSQQEMEMMIGQLEGCRNPHTCPHGRPTLIHLSAAQLAKEFGRT